MKVFAIHLLLLVAPALGWAAGGVTVGNGTDGCMMCPVSQPGSGEITDYVLVCPADEDLTDPTEPLIGETSEAMPLSCSVPDPQDL